MSLMLEDGKLLVVDGSLAMHERCCCADCCCDSTDYEINISLTFDETNPGGGDGNCPDPVGDHTATGTITGGPDGSGGCSYTGSVTGGGQTWLVCLTCGEFVGAEAEWVITAALNAGSCSDLECSGSASTGDGLYVSCSGGNPSSLSAVMDLVDGATTIGSIDLAGAP
jgi:hypothetical protein